MFDKMPKLRIGVVGYCPPTRFDQNKAREMLREAYDILDKQHPDRLKFVVSGLTHVGVPGLAYDEAANRNWSTVGIACSRAEEHKGFPVDEKIIVGKEWGDESQTFLKSINVLVRVGGGKQSINEAAEMKKEGRQVIEYDLPAL